MHPQLQLGSWSVPTYFLIISLDFCFLLWWLRKRSQRLQFPVKLALDLGIIASIAGFIGARLFHVLYEFPEFYWSHPKSVLQVWEGGYVFLAGLLVGVGAGLYFLKHKQQPILVWLDFFTPLISVGYAIGRWACFFQGCCYGQSTDSFLGMHFQNLVEAGEAQLRLPTQIFASAGEALLLILILRLEKQGKLKKTGKLFSLWLIGHSLNRMVMETLRDDPRGPLLFGMGVSFWIALLLLLSGGILFSRLNTISRQNKN